MPAMDLPLWQASMGMTSIHIVCHRSWHHLQHNLTAKESCVSSMISFPTWAKGFSSAECIIFSEVIMLLKLTLLPMPSVFVLCHVQIQNVFALNNGTETAECSHDASYSHKEKTDELSVIDLVNTFASTEHRTSVFGTFSETDVWQDLFSSLVAR